jgi:hypothetical protein
MMFDLNWWLIFPSEYLREQVKDSLHILVQLGFTDSEEALMKVELSNLIVKKFTDKFRMMQYNKKLFVALVGSSREEHDDCLLAATIVRDNT